MGNELVKIPPPNAEVAQIMAQSEEKQQAASLKEIQLTLELLNTHLEGMLVKELSSIIQEQIKMCVELVKLEASRGAMKQQQLQTGTELAKNQATAEMGRNIIAEAMKIENPMSANEIMQKFGEIMGANSQNMKLIQNAVNVSQQQKTIQGPAPSKPPTPASPTSSSSSSSSSNRR